MLTPDRTEENQMKENELTIGHLEKAFLAGRSKTSWSQFLKDISETVIYSKWCHCAEKHGETSAMHCNCCGGLVASETWLKEENQKLKI